MNGPSAGEPTAVTIFGRTYQLRGGADTARLVGLAAEVDRRMRDVADATGTADTLKVAILAALNLTDEYWRVRTNTELPEVVQDRLTRMIDRLDDALVESAQRSNGAAGGRTE